MANKLIEIPTDKWYNLRDLYTKRRDHASSYNTVQTFIEWIKKEPDFPVKIYSLNSDWETDGTFVAEVSIIIVRAYTYLCKGGKLFFFLNKKKCKIL